MSGEQMRVTVPRFLAYDEGCYECGEPSGVIGLFGSHTEADEAVAAARARQKANWRGQHLMHVIDLAEPAMSEHAAEKVPS